MVYDIGFHGKNQLYGINAPGKSGYIFHKTGVRSPSSTA